MHYFSIDSPTLIGAPYTLLAGTIEDLREPHAVIVDADAAFDKLATDQGPGKPKIPLKLGDIFELNDRRAKSLAYANYQTIFDTTGIYTTYKRALEYAPFEPKTAFFCYCSDTRKPSL